MYSTMIRKKKDEQSSQSAGREKRAATELEIELEGRLSGIEERWGLIEAAVGNDAERESEPRVFVGQQLSQTGVESGKGSGDTDTSTRLMDGFVSGELAGHEEEEGQVEEEEEDDKCDVNPQGCQEEEEGDNEPCRQKDSNGAGELFSFTGVSSGNTVAGVKEGRVGQPKAAVTGESSRAECIASDKLPHSSGELSQTTDEAGHTDDGICDSDTASLDVVHREDEGGGGEREETKRTRVADLPQRGGALHVGVGSERAMSSTGAVVNAVRIREGTLVVSEVAHSSRG